METDGRKSVGKWKERCVIMESNNRRVLTGAISASDMLLGWSSQRSWPAFPFAISTIALRFARFIQDGPCLLPLARITSFNDAHIVAGTIGWCPPVQDTSGPAASIMMRYRAHRVPSSNDAFQCRCPSLDRCRDERGTFVKSALGSIAQMSQELPRFFPIPTRFPKQAISRRLAPVSRRLEPYIGMSSSTIKTLRRRVNG